MKHKKNNNQGVLLIVVILVLILLIFIALMFANLATIEEVTVENFIHKRKATLASESGFFYAATRLVEDMKTGNILNVDWQYTGEDLNKNGILDPGEDKIGNGILDTVNCSLEQDFAVSYQYRKPRSNEIVNFYISNVLTFGEEYITFKLKAVDEASKININYGNLANREDPSNENLKRILNTLGAEIGVISLGDKILNTRTENGFKQLEELLNTALTYSEYQAVKDFITTFSFGTNLLKPQGLSGRNTQDLREGMPVYSISQIYPKKTNKEIRYFVNINTASFPVIVAVLEGLSGYYLDGSNLNPYADIALAANKVGIKNDKYTSVPIGIIRKTKPIDLSQAKKIAEKIIKRRHLLPFTDFYNKDGWDEFVEELYKEKIVDFYQKEVLRANFNPNVNSYLWNPDLPLRFLVDKFSLENYSFEWTFLPTGFFTIESIGEVFTKNILLGKTYTQRFVKLWDTSFLSTQEDFAGNNFQYFDYIFSKAKSDLYPTRLGTELDLYPFAYPLEKKASSITGYIGLSTISLPVERLSFPYKKDDKVLTLKPKVKLSFNRNYNADEPLNEKLLKSYEELPHIFTDGGFSDTGRTIRLQPIKQPDFKKIVIDPNKPPPATPVNQPYPVPVAIGMFKGNLTIMSDKLIGFLEEVNLESKDIFTGMTASTLAGVNVQDLKNKKIKLLLPHSCCFWDIYWDGGDIHFYVPKHAEEVIEKYFPADVLEGIKELCFDQATRAAWIRLGTRALECPLFKGGFNYSISVYYWHKGNWINKNAIYPLFSYGRFFAEELYGKNKTAFNFEPPPDDVQDEMDEFIILYRKKNRFHSALIQDFYFAFSFINKGPLFHKNKFTIYFDLAPPVKDIKKDEKNPYYYNYRYLASYSVTKNEVELQEGRWNHLGFYINSIYTSLKNNNDDNDAQEKGKTELNANIFKNNESQNREIGLPIQTKFLYGDMQKLNQLNNLDDIQYKPESPSQYVNPGLRFGEYIKRGYAKTDKPIFDPFLYGFSSSQSTYDEIYIYTFDQYSLQEKLDMKIVQTLFNAGRYYPFGGIFTIGNRLWKIIPNSQPFMLVQTHYYIPSQLEKDCTLGGDLYLNNSLVDALKKSTNNIFLSKKNIYANTINKLDIKINCSRAKPPILESTFVDSLFIFTQTRIKEVIASKEIGDVSF